MKRSEEVAERINSEFNDYTEELMQKPKMEIVQSWCRIGFYTAIEDLVETIVSCETDDRNELIGKLGEIDKSVGILDSLFNFYIGSEYCVLDSQEQALELIEEYTGIYE
jgi:hypothetical protein